MWECSLLGLAVGPVAAEDFQRVGGCWDGAFRGSFPLPVVFEQGGWIRRGAVLPVCSVLLDDVGARLLPVGADFVEPAVVFRGERLHDLGVLGGEIVLFGGISIEIVQAWRRLQCGVGRVEVPVERHFPMRHHDAAQVGGIVATTVFLKRCLITGPIQFPAALANGRIDVPHRRVDIFRRRLEDGIGDAKSLFP